MSEREWVPFLYREFHDYPRAVVVDLPVGRFMLDCPFDGVLDEYPPVYRVLRLAGDEVLDGSWVGLGASNETLGTVSVSPVLFDGSRSRLLRWDIVRRSIGMDAG